MVVEGRAVEPGGYRRKRAVGGLAPGSSSRLVEPAPVERPSRMEYTVADGRRQAQEGIGGCAGSGVGGARGPGRGREAREDDGRPERRSESARRKRSTGTAL